MLTRLTIPTARPTEPGLDQRSLYVLGLEYVQRLARRIWTDYNLHDPGATTLELLCYVLTDLTHRALLPIEDLLASGDGSPVTLTDQFFTARQILPNRAFTAADYRKLIIDLPGVKNAWIRPAALTYYADPATARLLRERPDLPGIRDVHIRGLYDVLVEYMDEVDSAAAKEAVLQAVRTCLQANRNLCEDFVGVTGVEKQNFLLCGELELTPDADLAQVEANVLFAVQQYLAPPVHNYTLSEMLERPKPDGSLYTVEDVFDGPALDTGFIDDAELTTAELREELHLSDIIAAVMHVPGVRAVRDMIVSPEGPDEPLADRWVVPVASGHQPVLNRAGSRVVLYKGSMPAVPSAAAVDACYGRLVDAQRRRLEGVHRDDVPIPSGTARRVGDYYSLQNHFPAVYGLSEDTLPDTADARRTALAYQLKAYLLFYDQLMADYCAQLKHLRDLFTTDPDQRRTYFAQVVDSFAAYQSIYAGNDLQATLDGLVEDPETAVSRRNRFLDHLLSRFAERFHDYANIMRTAFDLPRASLIRPKCEFLRNYPAIGGERTLAYDQSLQGAADLWNTGNVSGFERRVGRLLDIHDWTRRNLSELPYDLYPEVTTTPGDEFRFRVTNRTTGAVLLSSLTNYATADLARAAMDRAMAFAQLPEGYERNVTTDGRYYFNIIDEAGDVIARRIEYFDTEAAREAAIDELRTALQVTGAAGLSAGEGMYVIEAILLRPQAPEDPFLPICVDPNCADCADDDPYSYRLHVVLPAYAGRFARMEFRRFAEQVIREETPAHILPRVCWISREDMVALERAYREWLTATAAGTTAERTAKLDALQQALFAVKNVYPTQQLRDCVAGEERPKFVLGQTALGSGKGSSP